MSQAELLWGKTIGIDATTPEANAATRSLVRRDTRDDYERFVKELPEASGVPAPTRKEWVRFDRKRKKKPSNREWVNPHDPEAKIMKLEDGRTRLGHKMEEAVDLGDGGGGGAEGVGGTPRRWAGPPDGADANEGGWVGSTGPGSGDGPRISQRQDGAGIEGTRIARISVGNGSRSAQLEEDSHSLSAQRDALLPRLVFGGGGS